MERRHNRKYLRTVHTELTKWGEWIVSHIDRSAIGYPSSPNLEQGQKCQGSIVPDVMMSEEIRIVDRAVRAMPESLQKVICQRYVKIESVHWRKLDAALHWIGGILTNNTANDRNEYRGEIAH